MITKNFKLSDIDCANCAAKIERGIKKIKGVHDATVVFITKKVTITIEEGADIDAVVTEAGKIVKKVEPDCELLPA